MLTETYSTSEFEKKSKAGIRGGPASKHVGAPNYKGRYDVPEIIGNTVPVNSRFHMRKNFIENDSQFGKTPLRRFAGLALD
jgi:hypothetical protein